MKLHLPTRFRKAVLAGLAAVLVPGITLSSGASAAHLQPTLTILHDTDATAYPNASAYMLIEAQLGDEGAFITYDKDPDGNLVPRYHLIKVTADVSAGDLVVGEDKEYGWVKNPDSSQWHLDEISADIVYHTEADSEGRHLVYQTGSQTVFGDATNGDTAFNFRWDWEDFGTKESATRTVGSVADWRWRFKSENDEAAADIVYKYDATSAVKERTVYGGNAAPITGVFAGIHYDFFDTFDLTLGLHRRESFGGALFIDGATGPGSIAADFVSNRAYSETRLPKKDAIHAAGVIIDYSAKGGAIYNSSDIAGSVGGSFISNCAGALYFDDNNGINAAAGLVRFNMIAQGGAIHNTGSIGDSVTGCFIGNFAESDLIFEGQYAASFAQLDVSSMASGGAVYNAGVIEGAISGDFVGNYVYNNHKTAQNYYEFPRHSQKDVLENGLSNIITYAMGGAVFNGIAGVATVQGGVTVGSIDGNFIGNFAYDVDPFVYVDLVTPNEWAIGGSGEYITYKRHRSFGGAIYNGTADIRELDGVEPLLTEIGSVAGNYVGNYSYVKSYPSGSATMSSLRPGNTTQKDVYTILMVTANGGAIYNGIADVDCDIAVTSRIGAIENASFTGNYASINRITTASVAFDKSNAYGGAVYNGITGITKSSKDIVSVIGSIDAAFHENYALALSNAGRAYTFAIGGAIYNGVEGAPYNVVDGLRQETGINTSVINSIHGIFASNYAHTKVVTGAQITNPHVLYLPEEENYENGTSNHARNLLAYAKGGAIANIVDWSRGDRRDLTAEIVTISGNFSGNYAQIEFAANNYVDSSMEKLHHAEGGAIFSGVGFIYDNAGALRSTIGAIEADFRGNYAHALQNGSAGSTNYSDIFVAKGGAVANSVEKVLRNDGAIESTVSSIQGNFVDNSAYTMVNFGTAPSHAAHGGAIYNGIERVSDNRASVSAEIKKIEGDFKGNFTQNKAGFRAGKFYAKGGAIYNGIESVDANDADISAKIGTITGHFIENMANGLFIAHGGAIYNGSSNIGDKAGDITVSIGAITGDFIGNCAKAPSFSSGEAHGGAIYNSGKIGKVTGDFVNNRVEVGYTSASAMGGAIANANGKIELLTGHFINNAASGTGVSNNVALGGAISNGLANLKVLDNQDSVLISELVNIHGDFVGNSATANGQTAGGAIYNAIGWLYNHSNNAGNINNAGGVLSSIIGDIKGSFTENSVAPTQGSTQAFGGAIANGIVKVESGASAERASDLNNNGGSISFEIGNITGDFINNRVSAPSNMTYASGGAIANGVDEFSVSSATETIRNVGGVISAAITSVKGDFIGNSVSVANASANGKDARGGAVFNGVASFSANNTGIINNDSGAISFTIGAIEGSFRNNYAETNSAGAANAASGGAVFNGIDGTIKNVRGGIFEAVIDTITGAAFAGNEAKATGAASAKGGAIYNGLGEISNTTAAVAASIGEIRSVFSANKATSVLGSASGGAIYNSGTIGHFENEVHEGAYDGTVSGGVVNSSFFNNVADGVKAHGGGIWTVGQLAIAAHGGNSVFSGNTAGGESSGLYIASADSVVYLIAQAQGTITFDDIIEGTLVGDDLDSGALSTLRLRGYAEQTGKAPAEAGGVYLNHYVKNTHILMDDVTLYLGVSNDHNPEKSGAVDKTSVPDTATDTLYGAAYVSHILEASNLTAQSGVVNTVDAKATNYLINRLVTTGLSAVGEGEAYASYAIDILPTQTKGERRSYTVLTDSGKEAEAELRSSDVFTVGNGSSGYVSVSQVSLRGMWDMMGGEEDGTERDDDYGYHAGDRTDGGFNNYDDIYVQIINYVGDDYVNATDEEKQAMRADKDFRIQLDLSEMNLVEYERAHMNSNDVLAKALELVSVKTYHDGMHLIGWRDPLAAWAELDAAEGSEIDAAEHKSFTIKAGHTQTLTRNINIPGGEDKRHDTAEAATGPLMTGRDLRIVGEGVTSVLNVNRKNMLTLVDGEQNVLLRHLLLKNVQDDTIVNHGNLTFDTLTAYSNSDALVELVVDNRVVDGRKLTVTGHSTVNYTVTTTQTAEAMYGELLINDSSAVTPVAGMAGAEPTSRINIENEVSHQNITHTAEKNSWALSGKGPEDETAGDYAADAAYSTVTHLYTTKGSTEATHAFKAFIDNQLDMQGGMFNLHDMHTNRLQLRGLNVAGGAVVVESATVNLDNRLMGGIDAETDSIEGHSATGVVWLGDFRIIKDAERKVTHVKFVDEHVGQVVQDRFGIAQSGKESRVVLEGAKYRYRVTYANDEKLDETAAGDRNGRISDPAVPAEHVRDYGASGYYTFERLDMSTRLNPGQVTQQAAVFPMIQTAFNYSFHHAELYADNMTLPAGIGDEYVVVTPAKYGKEHAAAGMPTTEDDASRAERAAALKGGMWLRPYSSFESIPLENGPKVDSSLYGALVGIDGAVQPARYGWSRVLTGYLGYNGSRLRWDNTYRTQTNGALVGATETFYRGRFFTGVTANVGVVSGDTHSMYGSEDYRMYNIGVASRTGYSYALGSNGRYIIQPALQVAYTLSMVDAYTNAEGIRMKSSPMHSLQLHPMVKLIRHTTTEWKPYLTAGVVWTLLGKTEFEAEGEKLPGMKMRPYVEYGAGVQKTWREKYTIYGEVTGHSFGRQGVDISAGFRRAW